MLVSLVENAGRHIEASATFALPASRYRPHHRAPPRKCSWRPRQPVIRPRRSGVRVLGMTGLRVVVAEDDVLLREGIASLLDRSGVEVLGQVGDGAELLEVARRTRPDAVVGDVRMPPTHTTEGLQAARAIREELPETAILVLS